MKLKLAIPLVVLLAGLSVGGQLMLRRMRPESAPALSEGALAAMGGFRAIAAEVIWFRADRLQESGRYVELAQLAETLALLEPHTPEVWSYAAWNLAYNVSVMMPTDEDRWRWVLSAIRLLRDSPFGARMVEGDIKALSRRDMFECLYHKPMSIDIVLVIISKNQIPRRLHTLLIIYTAYGNSIAVDGVGHNKSIAVFATQFIHSRCQLRRSRRALF